MSEVVTIGTGSATIYGTYAGAVSYHDLSGSDASVEFRALSISPTNEQKRKLVDATTYLNSLAYATGYTTFAARDALDLGTGDGDRAFPFRSAAYLLAGLAAADADVLVVDDQGSNVESVNAGSAGVTFFNPTSAARGTAQVLPADVAALIGPYLATQDITIEGGTGADGSCVNPFGPCEDFDRNRSW